MSVIAIDPGNKESAYLCWDGQEITCSVIVPNEDIMNVLLGVQGNKSLLAIEMIASYGMAVGREVFETCVWVGRFIQAYHPGNHQLIYRKDIKIHHCQSMRATDANIRQSLLDKYGQPGTKKDPGLTYGLKKHLWSAFAIATYITERQRADAVRLQQNPTLDL